MWVGLLFGFFVGAFFFHGFGGFLFGFFARVLAFSHGGTPCECGVVGFWMEACILLQLFFCSGGDIGLERFVLLFPVQSKSFRHFFGIVLFL